MIKYILLTGKARSGKGTAVKIIQDYFKNCKVCNIPFASYIKDYAIKYMGWDGKDETKPREFLQTIGTQVIREKLNKPDFHVGRVCEDIEILQDFFNIFVTDDCRFPNEYYYSKVKFKENVVLIRIERDEDNGLTESQKKHSSETAMDDFKEYDYIIKNNSTLKEYEENFKNILDDIFKSSHRCEEMEQ